MGHKDSSITLRVYVRWMRDDTWRKGVDQLDEAQPRATPAQPARKIAVGENAASPFDRVVSRVGTTPNEMRCGTGDPPSPLRGFGATAFATRCFAGLPSRSSPKASGGW